MKKLELKIANQIFNFRDQKSVLQSIVRFILFYFLLMHNQFSSILCHDITNETFYGNGNENNADGSGEPYAEFSNNKLALYTSYQPKNR